MRDIPLFISVVLTALKLVHILSGDLMLHKRTLGPLKTVIYGLRRYDEDRCAALLSFDEREVQQQRREKVKGFMSHKSKIYLVRRDFYSPLWLS